MLLKRISQKIVANRVLVFFLLIGLAMVIAWRAAADHLPARTAPPTACAFDDCVDGCPPDHHCNMNSKRVCEPNTVIPGTLEIVMSESSEKAGIPQPQWLGKDEQGCPISSYGKYRKGVDGKCHWMPDNSSLGGRDKWSCNIGFEKVRVSTLARMPKDKNIDYKCVLKLK